ncbi:MAG: hypothetical protein WA860_10570 [Acidimicrobiales bacterium]
MSVEEDIARSQVEAELDAARAWAGRHNWSLRWEPELLRLRATTFHPHGGRILEVHGGFDLYKALPPAWRFCAPNSDEGSASSFPKGGPASIFHGNLVICAPWNRLAYRGYEGLHADWDVSGWMTAGGDVSRATTVADMLAAIDVNLHASPGMSA